ncbi:MULTISPECIES: MDR family oxidoreductase [unclassified Modicisalibacter]|uniref:MDR family oxidoreductase n=1 Tax=unclassified Modicisalibacter TaxID=2679913 RepID=UPI001CCFD0CA|nr:MULTISPECIES: MDR family oxidoreductase [unclassified Modicisalibacter]MBZ9559251.1 oxidoreductase [Modicisalibacter sp. R2A 31.J]MBZ9576584.1 oxidoreductase [Modicisalibacter sp. MOD 31.J]
MPRVLMLKDEDPRARVETIDDERLPERAVTVDIDYSDLNYKDALAVTGKGKIVREYPFVPGIDFAGTVRDSESDRYAPGDRVILTGWGVGERYWGGFAERMRVDADWLVPCPEDLTTREAMLFGTAGLSAMLAILRLEEAGLERGARVLVTGATGGVGSWAVQMLAHYHYEVYAVTGKPDQDQWLKELGATEVLDRVEFKGEPRPLEKARWAGAIDTVGDNPLANVIAQMEEHGRVAAVGLAGGSDLPTSVMPFILRGVSLLGVESARTPLAKRREVWQRIAELPAAMRESMHVEEIGMELIAERAEAMINADIHGRLLVDPHID